MTVKNGMVILTKKQLETKEHFIYDYIKASNAADGSKWDKNANVSFKNISTLANDLNKDIMIQINRHILSKQIESDWGIELSKEYIRQLEKHEIYCHDESSLNPYCASISMYPFLIDGMTKLGGESKAPKHLDSFCGSFINLCFAISSQFAGALATVEFLLYFDHFARKDYGDNYLETYTQRVNSSLQHVVYSLNQPAVARGYQSIFWNISIFDEDYFNALFGDFVFPDNYEKASYEKVKIFQEYFMKWFNKEREVSLLTFPVVTAALLSEDNKPKDEYFSKFISNELAEGNSFFIYQSDSADSLSSCCRLKNEFQEKPEFSFSLGAGGISTGSINVITLNLNRLFQDTNRYLEDEIDKIHKYQISFRRLIEKYEKGNLLSVYNSNFISLDKQFLTIGLNGIVEAAEYLGIVPNNNEKYKQFLKDVLETIYNKNRRSTKEYGYKFNTEFVPAESLGVKFSQWDKKKGYDNNRDCYNSYFYRVEDEKLNIIDKFELHGKEITKYLDGGSALHLNLEEHYDADGYYKLICLAIQTGVSYFTTNVKATCCEDCFSINKKTLDYCIKCGSKNISHATRIIGYLKKIKDFSQERREEHSKRFYH